MKIYFAGAIRGGRDDQALYLNLIEFISTKVEVLTEHVGFKSLTCEGEGSLSDSEIFKRDVYWLKNAQGVIAEVTTPSLGVGYELGLAETLNKPILCLYRQSKNKRLSAMLSGNHKFICKAYNTTGDAINHINAFLTQIC